MKGFRAILRSNFVKEVTMYFLICTLVFGLAPSSLLATPTGGAFTEGTGTIVDGVTDSTVMVDQASSVIEWDSLDTTSAESLTFSQQEGLSNSAVLNRVMSGSITQFDGTLNGVDMRIFIVNPAGVIFGDGAVINVNQLVASSLSMSNSDFMNAAGDSAEQMVFSAGDGDVTVEGLLDASETGSIYLVGKNVTNNGAILCPDGLVVMVAGESVRLGQPGSSVIVDMGDITSTLDADSDNVVTNNGSVGESESTVDELVLAAGDVFSQAIANVDNVTVIARDDVELGDVTAAGDVEVYSGVGGEGGATGSDITVDGSVTAGSIKLQASTPDGDFRRLYNINVTGDLHSTEGDVDISAREHVTVAGDITADNGSIFATADSDNRGRGNLSTGNLEAENGDIELTGRDVAVNGDTLAGGDLTIMAMSDWGFEGGSTVTTGDLEAGGNIDISVRESLTDETINGDGQITVAGDVVAGEDVILHNNTDMTVSGALIEAGGDVILANGEYPEGYDGACEELTGNHELTIVAGAAEGVDDGQIYASNTTISVTGSSLTLQQDTDLNLDDFTVANQSDTDLTANSNNGSVTIVEDGTKPENAADQWASVEATAYGDITLSGDSGDITTKQLTSETGDIEVNAKGGALIAEETIEATTGSLNLTGDDGIYAAGDLLAGNDVTINSNLTLTAGEWELGENGWAWINGDQSIEAAAGTVTAKGWIWKETPGQLNIYGGDEELAIDLQAGYMEAHGDYLAVAAAGNIYMLGNGDVQISGDVLADGANCWDLPDLPEGSEDPVVETGLGGVSIISENGKIYTQAEEETYALHVAIEGYSDQSEGLGVDLPGDETGKKAAIVLSSKEDLNLGEGTELYAPGEYQALDESIEEGYAGTDDRAAVNLLDVPEEIGGNDRDEGEPIDIAVYLESFGTDSGDGQGPEGNIDVDVDSIIVAEEGTVVVDAYDTITFGDVDIVKKTTLIGAVEGNGGYEETEGTFVIDRLEVVSRISEWLSDAVGRLPYANDAAGVASLEEEIGGDYVLRGAGLENSEITDGRAWVLEDLVVLMAAAPLPQNPEMSVSGCPALIQWTAEELGIEGENIQIWMTGTLASLKDIQPCDACASLKAAVTVLRDVDGTHVAALTQVIDEFASSGAPVSEEQMATIADAIANNTEEGNVYALADEFLEALTTYVTVVSNLGLSTEDAVTFATDKYIAPLIEGDNVGLATYLSAKLASVGQ